MARFSQVLVLSVGTLAGAAVGFYALEAYKVNEKVLSLTQSFFKQLMDLVILTMLTGKTVGRIA